MATHSSILAWRIPWTEEPGGLWSIVLQESDVIYLCGRDIFRCLETHEKRPGSLAGSDRASLAAASGRSTSFTVKYICAVQLGIMNKVAYVNLEDCQCFVILQVENTLSL